MALLVLRMERDVQFHASDEENVIYFKDATGVSVCLVKHIDSDDIDYFVGSRRIWRGPVYFQWYVPTVRSGGSPWSSRHAALWKSGMPPEERGV